MSSKYSSYIKKCNIFFTNIGYIKNFTQIVLTEDVLYCGQSGLVRHKNDVEENFLLSDVSNNIHIYYIINKVEPTRVSNTNSTITGVILNDSMSIKYSYNYSKSITQIVDMILNSFPYINDNVYVELQNITLKVLIPNFNLGIDQILMYSMFSNNFSPKERTTIISKKLARMIHITTCMSLSLKYCIVDTLTLAIDLGLNYGQKCLEISVRACSVHNVDYITWDILDFIDYASTSSYNRLGNRNMDVDYIYNKKFTTTPIKENRYKVPDLVIQRFTRESPKYLHISTNYNDAKYFIERGHSCIRYPQDGMWYISPDLNMYVGLKLNRLGNNDVYKYIPTIYKKNHAIIVGSNTYNYLNSIEAYDVTKSKTNKLISCISNILSNNDKENYYMLRVFGKITDVFNISVDLDTCILCKQDMPNNTVKEIYDMWLSQPYWSNICYFRRLIEHILNVDVIIVEYVNKFVPVESDKVFGYLWKNTKDNILLIYKSNVDEYTTGYEIVQNIGSKHIHKDEYVAKYFISLRSRYTSTYTDIINSVKLQYIGPYGRTIGYIDDNNNFNVSCTPPLLSKYVEQYTSHLDIGYKELDNITIHNPIYHITEYDNVIQLFGNDYYESELMPYDYVPKVIEDIYPSRYEITNINNIESSNERLYIINYINGYVYYLKL